MKQEGVIFRDADLVCSAMKFNPQNDSCHTHTHVRQVGIGLLKDKGLGSGLGLLKDKGLGLGYLIPVDVTSIAHCDIELHGAARQSSVTRVTDLGILGPNPNPKPNPHPDPNPSNSGSES